MYAQFPTENGVACKAGESEAASAQQPNSGIESSPSKAPDSGGPTEMDHDGETDAGLVSKADEGGGDGALEQLAAQVTAAVEHGVNIDDTHVEEQVVTPAFPGT